MIKNNTLILSPSPIIFLKRLIFLFLFSSISLFFFFYPSVVGFIFNNNSFITIHDLNGIFGDFKSLFSYVCLAFTLLMWLNMFWLFLVTRYTQYIISPSTRSIRIKKGILSKKTDNIDVENIADIDIEISVLENIFGLGTLIIYTSGDMSGISDKLTSSERKRLTDINKNVVKDFMSIKKMISIKNPQVISDFIGLIKAKAEKQKLKK